MEAITPVAMRLIILDCIRRLLDEGDTGTVLDEMTDWTIDWQDGELVIDGLGPDLPAYVVKLEIY